ncbi:PIG-L family deacetylase [Salipiger sp. P9]|nr:PIG-L family deacetylase [Salipiger pentaromativorans]
MNPTISELIDADEPVTTVYLTSGDFGLDESYWGAREQGEKDAYAHMAGSNDWVDETVSVSAGGQEYEIASSYLASQPEIRLYFMRLPDGFSGTGSDTYGLESLEKLWDGSIETMTAVDDSATYSRDELLNVLTALMDRHQPDQIHIQDHSSEHVDLEHSDHVHASEFAASAAADYSGDLTVTSYYGYATWGFEENVVGAEHEEMRDTFLEYAGHDPQVWGGDGQLIDAYEEWLQREYVAEEYTQGATPQAALAALMLVSDTVVEEEAQQLLDAEAEAADEVLVA